MDNYSSLDLFIAALSLSSKKTEEISSSRIFEGLQHQHTFDSRLQGIVLAIDDSQSHQQKDPLTENILACIKRTKLIKTGDQMKLGYTLFYVDDVEHSMNFYALAFGLEKGFLHESKQYGETKIGFVHHDTAQSHGFEYEKSHPTNKPFAFEIGFVTEDVEVAFKKAVDAGAVPVDAPKTKPWGQVVSYVRDCNGFLVEICSPIG